MWKRCCQLNSCVSLPLQESPHRTAEQVFEHVADPYKEENGSFQGRQCLGCRTRADRLPETRVPTECVGDQGTRIFIDRDYQIQQIQTSWALRCCSKSFTRIIGRRRVWCGVSQVELIVKSSTAGVLSPLRAMCRTPADDLVDKLPKTGNRLLTPRMMSVDVSRTSGLFRSFFT